ncbi:arylamine N-acetyltransferase family protein [Streptomyces lavendofoliae]|uniref:N-hydroxyarylamine O-acetyltransferase n=1 Tax=Streptomyces lavendofoliae TaxID=67314 RepID=A0A918HZC1_9ACTN|nr:arylamine N-acetyltransferase [Streptomyces lavendofoliae]GGU46840.1 N-hydroxyarylamine O-acetyltransferase [Streptomyces lavendofoliae]
MSTVPVTTQAYLDRIGAARPSRPDTRALRDLHLRHLLTVPFENLSIHLGEDIVLEEKALLDKVVHARRGGFCYELGGSFAALLRDLGFRVDFLQARTFGREGGPGIPYDHLALRVGTDDGTGPWLVDVGFGDHSHYPLALEERGDQEDPGGVFRVVETAEGDLDVLRNGEARYRLERRSRSLSDFAAGAWYHRTSPESHFTRSPVCSLLTEDGRVTLSGRKLVTTVDGRRAERNLEGDAETLAVYRDLFGIVLDRLPAVPGAPAAGRDGGPGAVQSPATLEFAESS